MELTKKQAEAMDALRVLELKPVFYEGMWVIKTGINTKVLSSLYQKGLIECDDIWLYGYVSTDLVVH